MRFKIDFTHTPFEAACCLVIVFQELRVDKNHRDIAVDGSFYHSETSPTFLRDRPFQGPTLDNLT